MNEDGVLDMIVCALSKKTCYVLYGGSSLSKRLMISEMTIGEGYEIVGDSEAISLVGMSVTGLGDMNDDGYDDIAISVMTSVSSRSNVVYVIYGNGKGEEVLLSSVGNGMGGFQIIGEAGYYTGFSISGVGDVNGDGLADLGIGKLPYPGTTSTQSSIIIFGSREGGDVLLSSAIDNEEVGRVLLVEGDGGFIVSGIGDINHDGIADVLLSATYDYVGESNAYIVTYPTNMTSPPTLQPSFSPQPTISPSMPLSVPTQFPSVARTSSSPSRIFTRHPTYFPSYRPSTNPTLHFPSSQPTSLPTSISDGGNKTVVISNERRYVVSFGEKNAVIEVQGSGFIHIKNEGGITFIIYPPLSADNKTILTISYFNVSSDTIDLQHLPMIQSVYDVRFTANPFTMHIGKNVKVICSSLKSAPPLQIHFIFASETSTMKGIKAINVLIQLIENPFFESSLLILGFCCLFMVAGLYEQRKFVESKESEHYEAQAEIYVKADDVEKRQEKEEEEEEEEEEVSVGNEADDESTEMEDYALNEPSSSFSTSDDTFSFTSIQL